MWNPFAIALMILAGIATLATWKTPRAWLWLGLGGASFLASSIVWDMGMREMHPVFTFASDALVVLAMHMWVREKWELPIQICFLVSTFCSLLKVGGFIGDGIVYASLLELCNLLALLWITGVGLTDLLARYERGLFPNLHRRLHVPFRAL
jgi:hypothetical protein